MNKLIERCSYNGKDVEVYQQESGLWSAYVRLNDTTAYRVGHNFPTREDIIYDLEYCSLAKRNPARKIWLEMKD